MRAGMTARLYTFAYIKSKRLLSFTPANCIGFDWQKLEIFKCRAGGDHSLGVGISNFSSNGPLHKIS
jgi:hypothetical protein